MPDEPEAKHGSGPIELIRQSIDRAEVPKIYSNAFSLALSNADIAIVFQRFGERPVAVVNLSYTLAKTLAQRLGGLVQEFESKISQEILTTDRIDDVFKLSSTATESKPDVH